MTVIHDVKVWESTMAALMDVAKAPYGNVPYADPGYKADKKKRYPIDAKHIHAALSYINQAGASNGYTPAQFANIKVKIYAAAKRLGVKTSNSK